jgi:hypothetical protein
MRVIVHGERPHPGAQLRLTDIDGHRFTAFAIDAKKGQLADLELRHRRRARCEDRIRCAKDRGLRNLSLKGFAQNQLWCEIVALACEPLAWTIRLTSRNQPDDQEGKPRGPWNPAHPARQPGSPPRPAPKINPAEHLKPPRQVRPRLARHRQLSRASLLPRHR